VAGSVERMGQNVDVFWLVLGERKIGEDGWKTSANME